MFFIMFAKLLREQKIGAVIDQEDLFSLIVEIQNKEAFEKLAELIDKNLDFGVQHKLQVGLGVLPEFPSFPVNEYRSDVGYYRISLNILMGFKVTESDGGEFNSALRVNYEKLIEDRCSKIKAEFEPAYKVLEEHLSPKLNEVPISIIKEAALEKLNNLITESMYEQNYTTFNDPIFLDVRSSKEPFKITKFSFKISNNQYKLMVTENFDLPEVVAQLNGIGALVRVGKVIYVKQNQDTNYWTLTVCVNDLFVAKQWVTELSNNRTPFVSVIDYSFPKIKMMVNPNSD